MHFLTVNSSALFLKHAAKLHLDRLLPAEIHNEEAAESITFCDTDCPPTRDQE